MVMRSSGSNGRSEGGGLEGLLEAGDAPCFLIDPIRSTLEAANAAARKIFRLANGRGLPHPLDSAMPALARLRQVLATARPARSETLSFWIAGQMTTLPSTLALVEAPDGRTLVLVRTARLAPDEQKSDAPDTKPSARTGEPKAADVEAAPSPPPARPRTDAETLREIARRIREGHPARQKPVEATAEVSDPSVREAAPAATASDASPSPPEAAPDARSLAQIAHELKTPLSAIVAASEIMRDQRLGAMGNARYLDYANDIHQSARHALNVVDAMLGRGAGDTHKTAPLALDAIAQEAVSSMRPLAEASHIRLAAHSDKGRLEVLASATAVRQILFNLINNALKFTPSGGEVHVLTGFLDDGSVYLVVRDTGTGMDEGTIARAFFGEGEAGTLRPGGGYGYGLPLVRQLAEMMGVALEVDSAPGKGTAILLSFPHYGG